MLGRNNLNFQTTLKIKNTPSRAVVMSVINDAGRPLLAHEIMVTTRSKLPKIGYSTIYRTIRFLLDAKLIREIAIHGESKRYEPVIDDNETSYYFKCDHCKKLLSVKKAVNVIERLVPKGCKIKHYDIVLYGICSGCCDRGVKGNRLNIV